MENDNNSKINKLVEMGFSQTEAQNALNANAGDLEATVNCLLTGGIPPPPTTTNESTYTSFSFLEGNATEEEDFKIDPTEEQIRIVKDIPYEPCFDKKHMLDIYIPDRAINEGEVEKLLPVVVHIHGGGWSRGDRATWFYGGPFMGAAFAKKGFVCVVISYRVGVTFPDPIFDVACAIRWTIDYISKHGGDPNKIFISGHSAGGHLASLLVSGKVYLDYVQIPEDTIKGVITISGIYTVGHPFSDNPGDIQNLLYRHIYVNRTFGTDPNHWLVASPAHIVSQRTDTDHRLPPFLIFNATTDFNLNFDGLKFHKILVDKGISARHHVVLSSTHATITRNSSVVDECVKFIQEILQKIEKKVDEKTEKVDDKTEKDDEKKEKVDDKTEKVDEKTEKEDGSSVVV